jgi:hypothetical protein
MRTAHVLRTSSRGSVRFSTPSVAVVRSRRRVHEHVMSRWTPRRRARRQTAVPEEADAQCQPWAPPTPCMNDAPRNRRTSCDLQMVLCLRDNPALAHNSVRPRSISRGTREHAFCYPHANRRPGMKDTMARGFASLNQNLRREISSKGGKVAHTKGTAHEWSREEAHEAARRGALHDARRQRPFQQAPRATGTTPRERGHDMVLHFEAERLSLQCLACGARTQGWTIDINDLPGVPPTNRQPDCPSPR